MRFIELAVEGFQALENARVAFGPGLNVLYGPNDLGKSTLAAAIRAALLVPYKSTEAKSFSSWYADVTPRVSLTFADDQEHIWQIKKAFGSGASAELLHSKDGKQFAVDCKAREVDEKVRDLLQWGLAALGGKGAPRGLPESFLAKVLLATQTDVDDILAASLEHDKADSGKLRLRKALAALAQDPLFKRVLDRAKQEYDVYFTPQGKVRRAEVSKLLAADKVVKAHSAELDRLRSEREESRGIEEHVRTLYEACAGAEQGVAEAEAQLDVARKGLANARRRGDAKAQLTAAEAALAEIDAQAARVEKLEREQRQLSSQLDQHKRELEHAVAEHNRLELAQREAEAELQRASSDAAAQKRKLREAELDRELAQLRETRSQIESRQGEAERARSACEARDKAAKQLAEHAKSVAASSHELTEARATLAAADLERDLARGTLAYGRWRAADEAAQQIQRLQDERTKLSQQAGAIESEANALREQHLQRSAELAARRAKLPTQERFKQLDALRQQIELTEASLGGGLSIRISPRRSDVPLRAIIDGSAVRGAEKLASEQTFEAERTARFVIADLVEMEVSAGAAEKRRELTALQQRWDAEVVPVLEQAAVASLMSLESALSALQAEDAVADKLRQQAETRAGDVRSMKERATLIGKQLASQPSLDVATRRAAIGSIALDLLEPRWRKLGQDWESQAEAASERAEQQQAEARTRCTELEQEHKHAQYRQTEAESSVRSHTEQAAKLTAALQDRAPSAVLEAITRELSALTTRQSELEQLRANLAQEAGTKRVKAEKALAAAKTATEGANAARATKQAALDHAKSTLDTTIGSTRVEATRLASMDRPTALQRLQLCAAQLESCPSAPLANESSVADAETALERARRGRAEQLEELHKAEGALTRVGGAQLQDRIVQAKEALDSARARERELKIDADAWKLLREALTQAETDESEHLGAALGRPVSEKLKELTRGRYEEIGFDQHMTAGRLKVEGATPEADVVEALSVGTRNQLATLVRLTIAGQLKSAIVLDDHLVHTDPARLEWFRDVLRKTALETQVLIFTCRPEDYLAHDELPAKEAMQDLAGGAVRAIDLTRALQRWAARPSHPAQATVRGKQQAGARQVRGKGV